MKPEENSTADSIKIEIPQPLQTLTRLFFEAGARVFAVGGMIRNTLLGYPISDMDITSALPPEDVVALCQKQGIRYVPKGLAFGTVELHYSGMSFEHTTFRADEYGAGGTHRPEHVRFSVSCEEDAFRRDFTVNALYYDILGEKIVDPTGGLSDLSARIIRGTSPDPGIILRDDALRILRMVRFASELGFDIEPATFSAAAANVQGLADISGERIRDELNKILLSDARYGRQGAVQKGLDMLNELGALDIILPELTLGRGLSQKKQYHAYDVLNHSLHTAQSALPELIPRLSGLLHDVGKPKARAISGRMLGHDRLGEPIAREILTRLKYPNRVTDEVCLMVRHHMYDLSGVAKENTLRTKFAELGYETSLALCDMREADVRGSGYVVNCVESAERWREILSRMKREGAPFSESELCCSGQDLMEWLALPPSPKIGEIKRALLIHCAKKPQDNTPERLKKIARDMK